MIEVAPTHCVVEIAKSAGDLRMYNEVRKHPVEISKYASSSN